MFSEQYFSSNLNITVDFERADNVNSFAINDSLVDVHVIDVNISPLSILLVPASPLLRNPADVE